MTDLGPPPLAEMEARTRASMARAMLVGGNDQALCHPVYRHLEAPPRTFEAEFVSRGVTVVVFAYTANVDNVQRPTPRRVWYFNTGGREYAEEGHTDAWSVERAAKRAWDCLRVLSPDDVPQGVG